MVDVPAGVDPVVETVNVDEPEPLTDAGLKLAAAPLGEPLALSDTAPLKPFKAVVEMV
jgi:hypothetical protein